MKKILCLLLALVMILGCFVGCGSKEAPAEEKKEETKTEAPAEEKKEEAKPEAPAEETKEEPVELSVILITGYEFFEDIIRQYEAEHENVKVDVQVMPTTDYKTLIKTKFAANDAPDIVPVFCEADYFSFYENGYLADLSDMTDTVSRLKGGADTSFRTDDEGLIGIPYTQEFLLCYYNKDIFAKYGLSTPDTWEQLLESCQVLKDNGVIPVGLGHKDAWVLIMMPYSVNATTVQHADPTFYDGIPTGTNKFADNAGWQQTLNLYLDLVNTGYVNEGSLSTTAEQMYEMFVNQESAMFFGGTWCDASVTALNPEFEVGGFQIPAPGGSKATAASISGGMGINGQSENMDVAKDLLAYMYSKENLEKYGSAIASCFTDVQTNLSTALQEGIEDAAGLPGYQYDDLNFASGVQEVMCSSIQEMIAGIKTPVEVLEAMDAATAKANR